MLPTLKLNDSSMPYPYSYLSIQLDYLFRTLIGIVVNYNGAPELFVVALQR